jgi:hypothetical protein
VDRGNAPLMLDRNQIRATRAKTLTKQSLKVCSDLITDGTIEYLSAQINAGAEIKSSVRRLGRIAGRRRFHKLTIKPMARIGVLS